jgi:hypothetical protein
MGIVLEGEDAKMSIAQPLSSRLKVKEEKCTYIHNTNTLYVVTE